MRIWPQRFEDVLFQKSRDMAPPWGPVLRILRFPAALVRDWVKDDLNVRAMSLAYTTLLSLVPLLVFSISILKGLGASGNMREILQQFLRPLGGAANDLTDNIMQFVTNMRGDVLGSIGLAFLVYTVISTIENVEASFNFVWRVLRPRTFGRRFTEYLSVMIIGPVLLAVAVGLLASARASPFAHWLEAVPPLAWLAAALGQFMPYVVVTIAFTLMYVFVPNTHVKPGAALIGGVTAGVMWAVVGRIFTTFILYSSTMVAVYTGFAIVLTTLIWVYLSWLILLIGAQLAFYVQCPQYLRQGQATADLAGAACERAGLAVMYLLARDYGTGKTQWTADDLAAELDVPGSALAPVLANLGRAGLIVATEKERLLPARDAAGITLASVVEAVRSGDPGQPGVDLRCAAAAGRVMRDIEAAIGERLQDRSIKDLIVR